VFVAEEGEATLDKLLVDGSDAVALGRITQMVKANGRRYSMDVAFHFTVEQGRIVRLHLYEDTGLVATTVTATA